MGREGRSYVKWERGGGESGAYILEQVKEGRPGREAGMT